MQNWINFWNLIFWLSIISFISNLNNFIKLLFYSELIWVLLYTITLIQGSINDDINLLSASIFILGFAGLEYSIGILIVMLFKNINNSIEFNDTDNTNLKEAIFSKNKLYLNRFFWNSI